MKKLFLVYRLCASQELRNSNGVGGVLVLADDEEAARLLAQDAATSGETRVHPDWCCALLSDDGSLPDERQVLFIGEVFHDCRRPV